MRKILVLGYFGYNSNQLDGQTVKTRDVYRLTTEQVNGINGIIDFYDTEDFQYHKMSIFRMFWKVIKCNILFYLPAHNNLKIIFPIIYCLSLIIRFKIHYFVVGGWLREFIEPLPVHKYMLAQISGIHVETKRLKDDLEEHYHYKNVDIFPNFRFFENLTYKPKNHSDILKIVFVSRVEQSKGLDTLLEVYNFLKKTDNLKYFTLDIYGQKKDNFFDNNLNNIEFFNYKGVLEPNQVISTLKQYDVLIFPSHYEGEGCPGILIEAMAAGLPIIASNWKYNNEFVEDGVNGFLCATYDALSFYKAIIELHKNKQLLNQMSLSSFNKSKFYSESSARLLLNKFFEIYN